MGFRTELEQDWEGGETAVACLHTAGSCREQGCSNAFPDWQGLSSVSTGTHLGPGLPAAASNPSELCPAWLCTSIHPAVLAAQWCGPLGRDFGGSVQDVSCPSPMNTSSWECGMPGFGGPLALLCSFPCYQNGRWRLCSCREGGRKVQLLRGRSNSHLPNPGLGKSSGAGACTGPENNLHICLQLLCPLDLPT